MPIDITLLTDDDIGKFVVYRSFTGPELGILANWNDTYIFVNYSKSLDTTKIQATSPGDLEFLKPYYTKWVPITLMHNQSIEVNRLNLNREHHFYSKVKGSQEICYIHYNSLIKEFLSIDEEIINQTDLICPVSFQLCSSRISIGSRVLVILSNQILIRDVIEIEYSPNKVQWKYKLENGLWFTFHDLAYKAPNVRGNIDQYKMIGEYESFNLNEINFECLSTKQLLFFKDLTIFDLS